MREFLFQINGEVILQIVFEALAELGLHSLAEPFGRQPNPWRAAIGCTLFGAVAGGLTLLVFPAHLVISHDLRIANLIITPIAVGLLMCAMGAWRARRAVKRAATNDPLAGAATTLTNGVRSSSLRHHCRAGPYSSHPQHTLRTLTLRSNPMLLPDPQRPAPVLSLTMRSTRAAEAVAELGSFCRQEDRSALFSVRSALSAGF